MKNLTSQPYFLRVRAETLKIGDKVGLEPETHHNYPYLVTHHEKVDGGYRVALDDGGSIFDLLVLPNCVFYADNPDYPGYTR